MKVMFIFPHPDDETIFAGGTIAKHKNDGDDIIWVCVSYGERSGHTENRFPQIFYFSYWLAGHFRFLLIFQKIIVWMLAFVRRPDYDLACIRKGETEKVARFFEVDVIFWEIEDMNFYLSKKIIEDKLIQAIKNYNPDRIYTIHPNGITGHPDHISLANIVLDITKKMGIVSKLFFSTVLESVVQSEKLPLYGEKDEKISLVVELEERSLRKKIKALEQYESQKYIWKKFLDKNDKLLKKEYFMQM